MESVSARALLLHPRSGLAPLSVPPLGTGRWPWPPWVCPPLTVWPGADQVSAWCSGHRCCPDCFLVQAAECGGSGSYPRAAWEAPVPRAPPPGQDWEGSVLALTWLGLFLSPAWISPASVNPRHPNRYLWLCLGLPRGQRLEMDLYSGLPLHEGTRSACGPAVSVHSWVLDASVHTHTSTVTPPLPHPHPAGRGPMKSETSRGGWCSPSPLPFTFPPNKPFQWGKDARYC